MRPGVILDKESDEGKASSLLGKCMFIAPKINKVLVSCRDRNSDKWGHLPTREAFDTQNPAYLGFWESLGDDVLQIASEVLA